MQLLDWYFEVDKSKSVKKLAHGSSVKMQTKTHKFVGIMYWDMQHAKMLKNDLPKVLQYPENHQRFIESVPFDEITGDYKIYARQISQGSVTEIDTYDELQALRNIQVNK